MIEKEKLIKLYDGVIKKEELTLEKLLEWNFSKEDLEELIKSKILKLENAIFTFSDTDSLTSIGSEAYWNQKDELSATELYKFICENIRAERYGRALNGIKRLEKLDHLNGKILLFLFLYAMPQYKDMVDNIKEISNLICLRYVPEKYVEMVEARKKMASYLFHVALIHIKKIKLDNGISDYRVETYRDLVYKCAKRKETVAELIDDYFKAGNMKSLKEFLECQPFLDDISRIVLKLIKDYNLMVETQTVSPQADVVSHSLFGAIYNNDYEAALRFLNEKYRNPNKKKSLNCLEYLLKEIIALKKAIISGEVKEECVLVRAKTSSGS